MRRFIYPPIKRIFLVLFSNFLFELVVGSVAGPLGAAHPLGSEKHDAASSKRPFNVLFIISDDLTANALSCYGNTICKTPNIDALAARGTRFTRAYCQGTYCGPSRASFMSGYYPHATGVLGYKNPVHKLVTASWSEHFKNNGYYAARVSKIFHMGVPGGVLKGGDGPNRDGGNGADDAQSWNERFNSLGPEWKPR